MQRTIRRRLRRLATVALASSAMIASALATTPGAAAQTSSDAAAQSSADAAGTPRVAAQTSREVGNARPSPRERRLGDRLALRRKRVRTLHRRVAPGVRFTKIIDERTPRRIFILRADLAKFPATFDVTLAGPTLGYRATVPQMAKANDAVAAINGDFSSRIVGRPIHAFIEDGTFVQSAGPGGASLTVSKTGERVMSAPTRQQMSVTDSQTGLQWRIDRWNNGPPDVGEIAAFTPAGGSLETPPADACSVHLAPSGPPTPSVGAPGFDQAFSIDDSGCRDEPMSVGSGGVVLSTVAGTDEGTALRSLALGTTMTIHLSLGFEDAYDVIGGDTMLVNGGRVSVPTFCGSYLCQAQPRTAIGVSSDDKLLMVVVDGRQPRYSLGLSMLGFARLMKKLGAVDALNLDGGGASTMVVRDKVVNRPSDGSLRRVATAAMILRGPDPDEP
jgi:hypothetical protein